MELWNHCMGPWCGEWPDYLKMDTPDHEAMAGIDIIDPDQVRISEKEESSESPVKCQSCDMSFDNIMDLFVHEIEQHPITSWHEEEDAVPENMISDILMMETPNLEMMLNEDFNMDLLTPEDGASRKRKSSDDESPIPQKCQRVSVIVSNPNVPQVGTGKVEPEKEKNPQPEDTGRAQEQDVGLDSPPVLLPEEQNPEPLEPENNDYQDRTAFRERLFSRQYKHRGSNDILQAGQQYKVRINRLLH